MQSIDNYDTTSKDTFNREDQAPPRAQQLQVLLRVARMRRRSQRQLLVQIEQEQHQQLKELSRSMRSYRIGTSVEISRSCSGIIEDSDEEGSEVKSFSSSISLRNTTDDS